MDNTASLSPIPNPLPPITAGQPHTAEFESHQVHYRICGQGPVTLVFLHGWACQLNFWHEQVSAFADRARLVFIDLPGHGQSDAPAADYTMDFHARAVAAVLRAANIERAVFIGHSRGAAVLCRLYATMPEKFAGLVSAEGLLCRPPGTPDLTRQFIGQFLVPEWQTHARNFFSAFFPTPGTERLRDQVLAEMLATPQRVIASEAESIASPAQPDWALPKIGVPLLVLNAPSPLWSERYEQYVKSLSAQADYRVMPGVGHFLMLEKPAEFNTTLAAMLEKTGLLA